MSLEDTSTLAGGLTPVRLAAMLVRAAAATPGPLYVGPYVATPEFRGIPEHVAVARESDDGVVAILGPTGDLPGTRDGELFAHAQQDVSAAGAEILRLWAVSAATSVAVQRAREHLPDPGTDPGGRTPEQSAAAELDALLALASSGRSAARFAVAGLLATVRAAELDHVPTPPRFSVSTIRLDRDVDAAVARALGYGDVRVYPRRGLVGRSPRDPDGRHVNVPAFSWGPGAAVEAFEGLGPGWLLTQADADWPEEYRWWCWLPASLGGDGTVFVGRDVPAAVSHALLSTRNRP